MKSVSVLKGIIIGTVALVGAVILFDLDLRKVPGQVAGAAQTAVAGVFGARQPRDEYASAETPEALGIIDWLGGSVQVTGRGARPARYVNDGQARLMAMGAAEVDAERKLAALVTGLRLDSRRNVGDCMQTNYAADERVKAFIRGARIIDERVLDDGTAEVDMELKLRGGGGLEGALNGANKCADTGAEPYFPQSQRDAAGTSGQTLTQQGPATGIIIDARGLDLKPALSPKVYTESGHMIYGISVVDQDCFVKRGLVDYASSVDEARGLQRVGSRPAVVKAASVRDGVNPVVPDGELQAVGSLAQGRDVVRQCKVVIVMD